MTTREVAIADFCETGAGSTPSRAVPEYFNGNVPWVKSGELRDGILTVTEEKVSDSGIRAARLRTVPKGSLLIAMYGATVGRTALLGVDATTNQAICHVLPDPTRGDSRYLWFALRAKLPEFLARRVGGAQPNLNQEAIRSTKILLPPLAEQRRIADILDKADTIRRKRQEAIALTEELLRSTFLEMFGDPVTNPKGWPVRAFDEAVHDATAGNFKIQQNAYLKAGAIPIIDQGSEFTGGWTNDPALVASVELPAVLFGDHTKVVKWVSRPFVLGADGVKVLVPKRGLTPQYLYMACSQFRFPNAGYSRHFKFLKLWRFPVPPMGPQRKFADIFIRVREHLAVLERAAVCSDQLFDALVARAFAGELESPR